MSEEQLKVALEGLKKKFREETKRLRETIEEMKKSHAANIEEIRQEHEIDRERIKAQELKIDELEFVIRKLKDEEVLEDIDEVEGEEEEEEQKKAVEPEKKVVVDEKAKNDLMSLIRVEKQIMKEEQKLKKFSLILSLEHLEEMEKTIGFNKRDWKRIFSAENHGSLAKHFHKRCDGYKGTIVVIRTTKKKKVFGGYNPLRWNEEGSSNQWYDSTGSYVFGFEAVDGGDDQKKKKLVKFDYDGKGYGIKANPHIGPCFGGPSTYALKISNDCQSSKSSFTKLGRSGYPDLGKGIFFLNGGKRGNFKVSDYEVFVKK